jgi:hypothetical protein
MWIEPRCLRSESECGEVEGGVYEEGREKRGNEKKRGRDRQTEREKLDQKRQTGLWLGDDKNRVE